MHSLADLFPALAQRFSEIPEMQEALIGIAWNYCVGEKISKVSRVVRFRDGILHVSVEQTEWKVTLTALKPDIIARMNGYLRLKLIYDVRIETEKV